MISKLKQARIDKNLSIEDVAAGLNIRRKYIIALEENNLGEIPGSVYVNGYLKMYCNYLSIPHSDMEYLKEDSSIAQNIVEPIFKNVSSRNRVCVAVLLILFLAGASWYYLSREVRHRSIFLMEHLEDAQPKNYLSNSADAQIINPVLRDENTDMHEEEKEINYNIKLRN